MIKVLFVNFELWGLFVFVVVGSTWFLMIPEAQVQTRRPLYTTSPNYPFNTLAQQYDVSCVIDRPMWVQQQEECIPVGCVPAARWPYAGVCFRGEGGCLLPGGYLHWGGSGVGRCLLWGGLVLLAGGGLVLPARGGGSPCLGGSPCPGGVLLPGDPPCEQNHTHM